LADLKGMKIRAPSRTVTDALNALGATPVGMPVPEVSQSLSMRVIDGAVIPWEVALPLRIHEVTQYHTEFGGEHGFYAAVFLFAMNKSKYESLPDDLKAVIDNNSGMNLAQRVGRAFDEAEEPGRQAAIEHGNEITVIPVEDVERWKEATQPVIDAWVESMNDQGLEGEKLLEEARSLIEQYSK
jgi:TRAP-type C4-dicarboxylate transport system substrate-binding protein